MMKNKKQMLLSSAVILLPMVIGVLLWDRLPDQIATHWGFNGEANGWSSKRAAVFQLPLFLLATHWVCSFFTGKDVKNKNQNILFYSIFSN